MGIHLKTHKIIWAKSGNKCAFPDCRIDLVMDEFETDDPSVVGQEAHIVARKNDGPRGHSDLTTEQRDKSNNLILLCGVHHKLIDDKETEFTVEKLHKFKEEHEKWVKDNLSNDRIKQREELIYSEYIDKILELADIDNWKIWSSYIVSAGGPSIFNSNYNKLRELIIYVSSRVWLGRYPKLEKSIKNIGRVTNDLLLILDKYLIYDTKYKNNDEDCMRYTESFYKTRGFLEQKDYEKQLGKYEYHCLLVEDLFFEFTRSFNHLFDLVRECLFPTFRIKDGVLQLEMGPFEDMTWRTFRIEYRNDELDTLYTNLRDFMKVRETRDQSRGIGISEDYFFKHL